MIIYCFTCAFIAMMTMINWIPRFRVALVAGIATFVITLLTSASHNYILFAIECGIVLLGLIITMIKINLK